MLKFSLPVSAGVLTSRSLFIAEEFKEEGQATRAVMWLKIVYSLQNTKRTPMETILKAYDDMPKVRRADFV